MAETAEEKAIREKKEAEDAAAAEKAKSEKEEKENGSLDDFLNDGKKPKNVDDLLKKEADKINKEEEDKAKAEKEKQAKPSDQKKADEKGKKVEPPKEEDEPIPDEMRKKYKIPDTIKTMKALAEWGPNAEKNMNKALAERDKITLTSQETEKRLAKMEESLAEFSNLLKKKVAEGDMSPEEKQIQEENLRYLMENKPSEFLKKIKEEIRNETISEEKSKQEKEYKEKTQKQLEEAKERQQKEFESLKKKYDDEEPGKFENEVLPALKRIAAEEPMMTSFLTAEKIYLFEKKQAEEKIKAEEDAKLRDKEGAGGEEASHKTAEQEASTSDEKKAKEIEQLSDDASLAELDKIAGVKK